MLAEVYQMPGSVLPGRDPDTIKVLVRYGLGLGGSGEHPGSGLSSGGGAYQELGVGGESGMLEESSRESRSSQTRKRHECSQQKARL